MGDLQETKRTSDAIAEALIAEIRDGRIAAGNPLPPERELTEQFGASRPTVRQALAQLQMRGYATADAGRRPRAKKPSLIDVLRGAGDHIREILGDAESGVHLEQMRQFIETGAVRELAMRGGNAQIAKLNATLDANYEAIGTDAFPETDIAFHRALVSTIDNPVILTLHDMFVSELLRQRTRVEDQVAHDNQAYEEHRAVFQSILDGDATEATAVMDRHLTRSFRLRLKPPKSVKNGPGQDIAD
ncbi:FCD domain-containing protein [Oceanibium sediminis]|uniref:FCD domain-containing protein n=1 Tax=Oceanibium sediminis TaxID=2026339 RepID=UPI000DD470D0|nr:FCD domain-containing protein [Oceanibium sediminis]